ncbi:MAG TPA: SEC-C domain-containing protein [Blastocatellia bacterium]|nr:SEC-C domain-containing protein [Blastocatellia bacterium]
MPLGIGGHRWLRLLFVAVALYLALLPLWWQALEALAALAAIPSGWLYGLFDPRAVIRADGKTINVFVTATEESGFGGQVHSAGLRLDTVTYGLPMLAALVLVTRADTIMAKLRSLAAGLAVMAALTVPAIMAWAKLVSLQLDDRIALSMMVAGGNRSHFFYYAFHGYAFSQPVLAVGIWMALMMLGSFRSRPAPEAAPVPASRNALCPCGSGRKYKRCCGRR